MIQELHSGTKAGSQTCPFLPSMHVHGCQVGPWTVTLRWGGELLKVGCMLERSGNFKNSYRWDPPIDVLLSLACTTGWPYGSFLTPRCLFLPLLPSLLKIRLYEFHINIKVTLFLFSKHFLKFLVA